MSLIRSMIRVFPQTIPVLIGYFFLGTAYGILMVDAGYGLAWIAASSLLMFAGSGQYVTISLLAAQVHPVYAFLVILLVNARHIFYGIALLPKYQGKGWKKWYMIWGMTDETFSINSTLSIPSDCQSCNHYFAITLLNHSYWVLSGLFGGLVGLVFQFDTTGFEFVLTALFIVIFLDQWDKTKEHRPALLGVVMTVLSLVIFGKEWFLLPAMLLISVSLWLLKPRIHVEDLPL